MRSLFPVVWLVVSGALFAVWQPLARAQEPAAQGQALVTAALANELRAAEDLSHPMRYLLRKSSPRLTTTRWIYETKDGNVARLVSAGDKQLSAVDERKEEARLAQLAIDPSRQRRRKQGEDADRARVIKVLRVLPGAFLYQDAGPVQNGAVTVEKFTFRPNPSFVPPDLETRVLTAMAGELWIDPARQRVVRLEGRLQRDVDYGWGLLGRLYKGGWVRLDQADVGGGQWRVVRFQMVMNTRIVFKTKNLDTVEVESEFAPLPVSMSYQEAIDRLRGEQRAGR